MNKKNSFRKNEHRAWHFQNLQHFGTKISYVSVSGICNILHLRISYFSVLAGFLDLESFICSVFATFPTLNLDFISCSILEHVQSQTSYLQGTCSIPKKTPGVHLAWWLHHMRHNLLVVGMLDTKNDSPLVVWSWKQVFVKHFGTWICLIVMLSWIVDWCWRSRVELKKCWRGRAGCGAHGVEPHVVGDIFFSCFILFTLVVGSRYFWNILPLESFKKHVWIQLSFGMVFARFGF